MMKSNQTVFGNLFTYFYLYCFHFGNDIFKCINYCIVQKFKSMFILKKGRLGLENVHIVERVATGANLKGRDCQSALKKI